MFYMLANVRHQIVTKRALAGPHHWCTLLDLLCVI